MEYKVFGCKTNKFYTEKWMNASELVGKQGVFVASCVVTDAAKHKWIRFVRKQIRSLSEHEKLYLSGCGTLQDGKLMTDFYTRYPELLPYKNAIILLAQEPSMTTSVLQDASIQNKIQKLQKNLYTRKHIVIQTGCDTFCTFCATIQARGRHKSRPKDEIVDEIRSFHAQGGKEIVLTGINLGAWGAWSTVDIADSRLPELITDILSHTDIPRIRISSLGVEFISDELLKLCSHPRINPHFHISIQSASDDILKRMNRKYDRAYLLDRMRALRSVQRADDVRISIGADLIVGFPGETQDDFQDTCNLVKDFQITKVHGFSFSAHHMSHDVPAAQFPDQIEESIKKERLHELLTIWEEVRDAFLQANSGTTLEVLIEKIDSDHFSGWSQNYITLNEHNFTPETRPIRRGSIVRWVYAYLPPSS